MCAYSLNSDLLLYNGPYILRPPIQTEKCGLKVKVVLKWRDVYAETMSLSLTDCHKTHGSTLYIGLRDLPQRIQS